MTINEAIGYADALARNTGEGIDMEGFDVQVFGMLCRDALHLAEKMEEGNSRLCEPDTCPARMQREYRETKERYEKLHRMVTKLEAGALEATPKSSIELLRQQKKHMGEYLHDLEVRGYVEGVEL